MEDLVKLLIERGKTISTMESCTGGGIANALTNIPDASKVIKYSAVTYSNEFKIKMGVSKEIIDKYSVYSMETAKEMALSILKFADSDYGVGVTGKLKKSDDNNPYGEDDVVYLVVCEKSKQDDYNYYLSKIKLIYDTREDNKKQIINELVNLMKKILNNDLNTNDYKVLLKK